MRRTSCKVLTPRELADRLGLPVFLRLRVGTRQLAVVIRCPSRTSFSRTSADSQHRLEQIQRTCSSKKLSMRFQPSWAAASS
jgi:hypothetical protein